MLSRPNSVRCSSASTEWPSIASSIAQRSPMGPPPSTIALSGALPAATAAAAVAYSPCVARACSVCSSLR